MILTGIAVLRTGGWSGWRRFAPLACGLYPFVIELPAFAAFGIPNTPAITGIGLGRLVAPASQDGPATRRSPRHRR